MSNELAREGLRVVGAKPHDGPYVAPVFDSGAPLVDVTDVSAALALLDDA